VAGMMKDAMAGGGSGPASAGTGAFCTSCGAKMPDGARFCPACGAKRA